MNFWSWCPRRCLGERRPSGGDGRSSYALFNLLWLRGWHPYVSYYAERSMDRYTPDHTLALTLAENLGIDPDDRASVESIYRFVMEKAGRTGSCAMGSNAGTSGFYGT